MRATLLTIPIALQMTLSMICSPIHADGSGPCADPTTYRIKIGAREVEVPVGEGGRLCDADGAQNLRRITRFSPSGGLTVVSSAYSFFGGRVRLRLRHARPRCQGRGECTSPRAGERCGILNAEGNLWPGAEAYFKNLKPDAGAAPTRRLAFERVAWNALLGSESGRELIRDQTKWAGFGLTTDEQKDLAEDLEFSRRHCDEITTETAGDVLPAGRAGVIEGERLLPLGELVDGRWTVSEGAFHSLYRRFDGGAREVFGLRTAEPAPLTTKWFAPDVGAAKVAPIVLTLPVFLTPDELVERRGFFKEESPAPAAPPTPAATSTATSPSATPPAPVIRVLNTIGGTTDPERWTPERPAPALVRRAREAFRTDHPRRFECLPRGDDDDAESLSLVTGPFADRELDVFKSYRSRRGDALVGVKTIARCRQTVFSETGLATVLQRHWYFIPKQGAARLVTRAKDALRAVDFDGDGWSEWVFASVGVDEHAPYYYALFSRPRFEVIESH